MFSNVLSCFPTVFRLFSEEAPTFVHKWGSCGSRWNVVQWLVLSRFLLRLQWSKDNLPLRVGTFVFCKICCDHSQGPLVIFNLFWWKCRSRGARIPMSSDFFRSFSLHCKSSEIFLTTNNKTISDGGITVDFWFTKVHTSNWSPNSWRSSNSWGSLNSWRSSNSWDHRIVGDHRVPLDH